jgi:hypothetical protein
MIAPKGREVSEIRTAGPRSGPAAVPTGHEGDCVPTVAEPTTGRRGTVVAADRYCGLAADTNGGGSCLDRGSGHRRRPGPGRRS